MLFISAITDDVVVSCPEEVKIDAPEHGCNSGPGDDHTSTIIQTCDRDRTPARSADRIATVDEESQLKKWTRKYN